MMDKHPEVVCLHEFFTGLDWGRRFQSGQVDAAELTDFLTAEQAVTTEVLARGYTADEICYPFGEPQARLKVGDRLPWLLISMLSRLSDDPDTLFTKLESYLRERPTQPLQRHYPQIFDWLARESGGRLWIERSGSSVDYMADLIAMFPDARFVHIHRDGREAALSIRAHPFYRLGVALLMNLFPDHLEEDKLIDYVLETPPPLEAVGEYWSNQVVNGKQAAELLDDRHYLEVSFEALVENPVSVLHDISAFFELPPDETFLQEAAALSRGLPARRFEQLSDNEQAQLEKACLPGMRLLNQ